MVSLTRFVVVSSPIRGEYYSVSYTFQWLSEFASTAKNPAFQPFFTAMSTLDESDLVFLKIKTECVNAI